MGEYLPDGRQFVIVCGNVNFETVKTFLGDFFNPAREDIDVEVVFLNKTEPDLEFEGLLKREHTRVQYFRWASWTVLSTQQGKGSCSEASGESNKFSQSMTSSRIVSWFFFSLENVRGTMFTHLDDPPSEALITQLTGK